MGEQKEVKKRWQLEEEPRFTKNQKKLIVAVALFVPFLVLVIIPLLARAHFVKELKIPKEIFLSTPQKIFLVKTSTPPPTYKVKMNDITFRIPDNFTPTKIYHNLAKFRSTPRRISTTISIASQESPPDLKFSITGFARWFMPSSRLKFMQKILRSTWHPIYLMFKAQLYASEGITGKVFEARWDANHRGFIFPTSGEKGYIGRIFQTNGKGYFEFSMADQVKPITLRQWVNIAMKIKPPQISKRPSEWSYTMPVTLNNLIEQAKAPEIDPKIIGESLSNFFEKKKPKWLIPVAMIMSRNRFYSEVLDLHKQYLQDFPFDSKEKKLWNQILDETVKKIIKIDIDPVLNEKKLQLYCKNATRISISQIFVKFILKYPGGIKKSFLSKILTTSGNLLSKEEKDIELNVPDDITLNGIESIDYRVMQVDFVR